MKGERFRKKTQFIHGYHKVKEGNGVAAMKCCMVLIGKLGAISFGFSTGMFLPETYKYWASKSIGYKSNEPAYSSHSVDYHMPERTEDYETETDKCPWIGDKPCYGGGSYTLADDVLKILMADGEDAMWDKMKEIYKDWIVDRQPA